jgi:hypothetical protein
MGVSGSLAAVLRAGKCTTLVEAPTRWTLWMGCADGGRRGDGEVMAPLAGMAEKKRSDFVRGYFWDLESGQQKRNIWSLWLEFVLAVLNGFDSICVSFLFAAFPFPLRMPCLLAYLTQYAVPPSWSEKQKCDDVKLTLNASRRCGGGIGPSDILITAEPRTNSSSRFNLNSSHGG